jgi:hypothetical protein
MALHVLLQEVELTTERVVHEATHDVEFFVWVLSYCVMRNLGHLNDLRRKRSVTSATPFNPYFAKLLAKPPPWPLLVRGKVGPPKELRGLIHRATDPFNPILLTHNALLAVVNQGLVSLQ